MSDKTAGPAPLPCGWRQAGGWCDQLTDLLESNMSANRARTWSIPGSLAEEKTLIVLTICSTKGGVGKTTLTANLAGFLADAGQRDLLVDADIQPTLSSY
jgi:Mrp family chromosome partitioning ATPase